MKHAILIILIVISSTAVCQPQTAIDRMLAQLTGTSENLINNISVKSIIGKGKNVLTLLAAKFTDNTITGVFSKCAQRNLTIGELAIIVADRIETMPYYTLTGLQNCTMQSCENNPNFVEYYLEFIRMRGMTADFQKKYHEWLNSRK